MLDVSEVHKNETSIELTYKYHLSHLISSTK
jgi:hypothetical protein